MSETIAALYEQLQRFSHLQKLHAVLSRDITSLREKVRKAMERIRRELTFFHWCSRSDLSLPSPLETSAAHSIAPSMSYDQLLFYRQFVKYFHTNPGELGTIVMALRQIRSKPETDTLAALYFDMEAALAECICFDILGADVDALVLLLHMILSDDSAMTPIAQKVFELFIVISSYDVIDRLFRPCLNRIYEVPHSMFESVPIGSEEDVEKTGLYLRTEDVLRCILETIRILPTPLRRAVAVVKERVHDSESELLEWLVSRIFSPLLLQHDEWLLVIANPPLDSDIATTNIHAIVNQILQVVVGLNGAVSKARVRMAELCATESTADLLSHLSFDCEDESKLTVGSLLLQRYGVTLVELLRQLLNEKLEEPKPSRIVVPTIATPELFQWHRILLKMADSDSAAAVALLSAEEEESKASPSVEKAKAIGTGVLSTELTELLRSCAPSRKPLRPFVCIHLPTLSGTSELLGSNIEDLTQQPKSEILDEEIAKPIRMFLLSLNAAQSRTIPVDLFSDSDCDSLIELNAQQKMLLHECSSRAEARKMAAADLEAILGEIVVTYKENYCHRLQESLSTQNILTALNFLQDMERTLKELKVRTQEGHENLQIREILTFSKPHRGILRSRLKRIRKDHSRMIIAAAERPDWSRDKFVMGPTQKAIGKVRNTVIKFLNDQGIGHMDFKRKYGGTILNFGDKRISNLMVNSMIKEVSDLFWIRCSIEDYKFFKEMKKLNAMYDSFDTFYDGFITRNQSSIRPHVSDAGMHMVISEFSKMSAAQTVLEAEMAVCNCREMLVAAIHGADSATGDDYMPLLCYVIVKAPPSHLPSQLQMMKVISQKKTQDKYYIDAIVAMKALRNFAVSLWGVHSDPPAFVRITPATDDSSFDPLSAGSSAAFGKGPGMTQEACRGRLPVASDASESSGGSSAVGAAVARGASFIRAVQRKASSSESSSTLTTTTATVDGTGASEALTKTSSVTAAAASTSKRLMGALHTLVRSPRRTPPTEPAPIPAKGLRKPTGPAPRSPAAETPPVEEMPVSDGRRAKPSVSSEADAESSEQLP